MGSQYTSVSISNYNANPPADDGSQTEANRLYWSTIKDKLGDPTKDAVEQIDTNLQAAFGKIDAGVVSYSTGTTLGSTVQGKLVRFTQSGVTHTTPDAATVGSPFVFDFLNDTTGDIVLDGNGSQTIDGQSTVTIPAGTGGRLRTDGSNWFTSGQNAQRTLVQPQGYLTLMAIASQPLSPLPTTDQSAKTAVYYRPFRGDLLPIPDGTDITVRAFTELTLSLVSSHAANAIYDIFAFDDSGTIRIGTGPAWTTPTAGSGARGTGGGTTELDVLHGLPVNKVSMTARNGSSTYSVGAKCGIYLGSLSMDGTNGQVSCLPAYGQSRKWGVWNAFNRLPISLKMGDGTTSWIYATNTIRQSRATAGNTIAAFCGLAEERIAIRFLQTATQVSGSSGSTIGIGINSTTAYSGKNGSTANGALASQPTEMAASYTLAPALGINNLNALENAIGGQVNNTTFYGTEAAMLMTADWNG